MRVAIIRGVALKRVGTGEGGHINHTVISSTRLMLPLNYSSFSVQISRDI